MLKYYLITGKECGVEIKPFILRAYDTPYTWLEARGDSVRYYEELTQDEAQKLVKKGMQIY